MTQNENESPACVGGAGGIGHGNNAVRPQYTTTSAKIQAPHEAVYHLARLLAGASDADTAIIRAAWPDCPAPGIDAIRAWLIGQPDLLRAVLATAPDALPRAPKTCWTVRELLMTEFPELRWIVPDLVPEGLTLLAGRPKLGKSWLALQIACAVGTGGRVFGQQVKQAPVLVLALEDSPRRLQRRIRKQEWPATGDITFYTEWPDLAQSGGLVKLQDAIIERGYILVIVDTLTRAARFDQNDIGESTAVLGNLQRLAAEHHCAILLVDHYRKPVGFVGDLIDDILGSTGKAATADAIMGLVRERGKRGATLRVTGRDIEERDLAIEWDAVTCCWQFVGDADTIRLTERRQEILDALASMGRASLKEIADLIEQPKSHTHNRLQDLVNAGLVVRREQNKKVYYELV